MATVGSSASSAATPFALRKNYVTLKQLQEQRLKEQLDEEEKLRDCDFNIKGAEAARSSGDRPPRQFRRRGVPCPAPLSISEFTGGKGTTDDSTPTFAIGESAGGNGKRTWKGKDTAKSDEEKGTGPEESSENSIPVKKEGNGRNRRARPWAQRKLAGVSGGESEMKVLKFEQASWDKPIPAKEGKGQNRQARPQPKLPGISGGASEVLVTESEEASSKNDIPVTKEGKRRNQRRPKAQRKSAGVSGGRPDTESEGPSSKNLFPMKKVGKDQNRRRATTQPKLAGISDGEPEVSTTESKETPSKNPIPTMKKVAEDQNRRRAMAQPKLAGVSGGQPKDPIPMNKEREVQNRRLTRPNLAYDPSVQMQQHGFKGGDEAVAGTPRKTSNPARGDGPRSRKAGPDDSVWVRKTPSS